MAKRAADRAASSDPAPLPYHLQGTYWFRVSANFMKYYAPRLPPIALNVYIYLCYRANEQGFCWPSVNRMARDLNLSRSSIQRALKRLHQAELVIHFPRYANKGAGPRSNYYRLCPTMPRGDEMADDDTDVEGEGEDWGDNGEAEWADGGGGVRK